MAVYRVVKEKNYTVVDNGFIDDPNLSWKAKGILLYFLRLPSDWKINLNEIERHATDGISSLKAGIKELTKNGYTKRQPVRDENGVFVEWETLIFEKKRLETIEINPLDENPLVENPLVENPLVENQTLLNTNSNKYLYKLNTEYISKDDEADSVDNISWKKLIVDEWNSLDDNIPKLQALNPSTNRYNLIQARINQYGIGKVVEAIKSIDQSDFLKGYKTDFRITFDWFIKPNNFVKVMEGNFLDRKVNQDRYQEKEMSIAEKARMKRLERLNRR